MDAKENNGLIETLNKAAEVLELKAAEQGKENILVPKLRWYAKKLETKEPQVDEKTRENVIKIICKWLNIKPDYEQISAHSIEELVDALIASGYIQQPLNEKAIECPNCGKNWDIKKNNACLLQMNSFGIRKTFNECEINGKVQTYDACCECSLEEGKQFYGNKYAYIGSSFITYHNGVKNTWDKEHHFFNILSSSQSE